MPLLATIIDPASTSPGIFPAYVKGITIFNRGSELILETDFVLKQFFSNNPSLSDLKTTRDELRGKLSILVVATTDKELIDVIFSRREILTAFVNPNPDMSPWGLSDFDQATTSQAVLPLDQSKLNLNSFDEQFLAQLGDIYGSDLPFSTSFTLPGANPQYLALFVVPIYDSNADNDIGIITPDNVIMGNIANEIVIAKGEVNTESILFYKTNPDTGEEMLWIGDVHQDAQGSWRTGKFSAPGGSAFGPASQLLTAKTIHNSKISDHRNLARIERLQIGFDQVSGLEGVSKAFRERLRLLDKIKKKTPTYISDIYYAKDEANELKLYFAFDYLSAIKNNTKYASLYSSKSSLLSSATLLSAKIIRRRIREANAYNKLTGGDIPNRIFDNKIEVVGSTNDGSLRRISAEGPQTEILQYVIADLQMNDITTGLYEYGIEVEILDNTKDKLLNILIDPGDGLEGHISELEAFLTHSLLKGNYDIITNRYTNKFKQYILETYGQGFNVAGPWPGFRAIAMYSSAIQLLFGGKHAEAIQQLYVIANPLMSGPAGIQYLIRLLKDFASSLRFAIGISKGLPPLASAQNPASSLSSTSGKRIISIKQFFQNPMDADDLLEYGLDYLNTELTKEPTGGNSVLKVIPWTGPGSWAEIDQRQKDKLGGVQAGATDIKFLTPNFLRLPGAPPLDLYSNDGATKMQIINSFYRILEANMTRNSPWNIGSSKGSTSKSSLSSKTKKFTVSTVNMIVNKNSLLNLNNCVVTTFKKTNNPIQEIFPVTHVNIVNLTTNLNEPLDASVPLSPSSDFVAPSGSNLQQLGSDSIALMQQASLGSTSNMNDQIEANMSLVSDALLVTDFFNGSGPGNAGAMSPVTSFSSQTALKGGNSVTTMQKAYTNIGNQSQVTAVSQPLIGFSAATAPHDTSTTLVSPSEMQLIASMATVTDPGPVVGAGGAPVPPSAPTEHVALTAAKYGFIQIVEYLAAYRFSTGPSPTVLIKDPVWIPLQEAVVTAAQAAGSSLICRLRKHQTVLSNFEGLRMPIYNKVFILGGTGAGGGVTLLGSPAVVPTVPPSLLPTALLEDMGAYADQIEYANSYDRETKITTIPPPVIKLLVGAVIPLPTPSGIGTAIPVPPTGYGGSIGSAPSTPSTPSTPSGLTTAQRKNIYKDFYRWYHDVGNYGGPFPVMRWFHGDGPFRPWPGPRLNVITQSELGTQATRAMFTIKALWNGRGATPKRRDIVRRFEQQKGVQIPGAAKNPSVTSW